MILNKNGWLILFFIIVVLATFLRFYNLKNFLTFASDQGRDLFVVRQMIEIKRPVIIGPAVFEEKSGIYLGPIFYYFLILPLLFTSDPTAPAVLVVLFSLATLFLIYKTGKEFFSPLAGIIAATIWAVSQIVVSYSRFSWNPNILPFFSLLFFYSLLQIAKGKEKFLLLAAFALGVSIQLHSSGFLLLPILFFWFVWFRPKIISPITLISFLIFFLLLSPYLYHQIKNDFSDLLGYWKVIASPGILPDFLKAGKLLFNFFINLFFIKNIFILPAVFIGIIFFLARCWNLVGVKLIFLWMIILFLGILFYPLEIYNHFFLWAIPTIILSMAGFLDWLWRKKIWWLKFISLIILFLIIFFNQEENYSVFTQKSRIDYPVVHASDILYKDIERAVNYILTDSGSELFEVYFVKPSMFDNKLAYEYLFKIRGKEPSQKKRPILYIIVQPKDTPVPNEILFSEKEETIRIFGQVKIIKVKRQ